MSEQRLLLVVRRVLDALLVALVVLVVGALFLARGVPLTGRQTLVIDGGSMEPAIPLGSAVVITPLPAATLAVGQVVSIRVGTAGTLVTHRITRLVDRAGGAFVETKGDANPEIDPAITPVAAVVGRVDRVIPAAGYAITLLSSPIGLLFVLAVAATILVATWLLDDLAVDERVLRPGAGIPAG